MRALRPVFLLLLLLTAPRLALAQIAAVDGPPAGFEELAAPRLVMVTVFYGGAPLGLFAAHVTPGAVRFDRPADLLAKLPPVSDASRVTAALASPLPANPDLLCTIRRPDGCGRLVPDVAGIIYDDNRQSAELFINPHFLPVSAPPVSRFLPLPEHQLSSVYNFNGAVNGGTAQTTNFALTNTSIAALGEAKLTAQSTIANQGLRFDEAAASIERNGWAATGGLFRSRAMTLLSNRDMAGVSFASSSHTVVDAQRSAGNAIIVYLPRRAFVSLYREGRLYSSRAYDAGNQELDTSELPEGAYEITVRIEEADGTMREEKRFFVKTQDLPPPGHYSYYAQAGLIRQDAGNDSTLPSITAHPLFMAGAAHRLSDSVAVHVSAIGLQDRAGLETGLFAMTPHVQATATIFASTKGDAGAQAGLIATTRKVSAAFDLRQTWFADAPLPGFGDQPRANTQGTATLSYALSDRATLGARGSYSRQTGLPASVSAGPYAEWRIWQEGESSLAFDADMARTNGLTQGDALLHFTRRLGKYGVTTTAGGILGANGSPTGSARVWHDDDKGPDDELAVGAGVSGDRRARTADADADWRNRLGQLRGTVQESDGDNGRLFAYGGNFAVGAAQVGSDLSLGGNQVDQSAVIIELSGDGAADMTVFVNGAVAGTVAAGARQTLYLAPFHTYAIRIAPKQSALLDFEAGERRVTLYPGNVVKLAWTVRKFHVAVGHVATPDGRPLRNALLQGSREDVTTDDAGGFEAETSQSDALIFTAQGRACHVVLPSVPVKNGVAIYRQALMCTPAS